MEEINNKYKKKPTKIEDMTKEQIREAIVRKRECNTKALKIVESLLDKHVDEDFFIQCLPNINQSHFEDVIEERAITQLCGYPLCHNALSTKDIPKQTYRISVKTNKVYDITTRKSFCSNSCYKSAMHVKNQMLTSPLWFREYEVVPKFHLLPLDAGGSLGQEVELALVNNLKAEKPFTSINHFASITLNEIEPSKSDISSNNQNLNETNEEGLKHNSTDTIEAKMPSNTPVLHDLVKQSSSNREKSKPKKNPLNIVGEINEKPERKIDPILYNAPEKTSSSQSKSISIPKTSLKKKQPAVTVLAIEVEKCLAEWFTIDTLLLLFGNEKVKQMLTDKGECIQEYLNNYSTSVFYNSNNYDQYQALCKKLNMLEMEDKRCDSQSLQKDLKPLPDYSILQDESRKIQLKVRAFIAGETDIPIEERDDYITENNTEDDSSLTQLPLVDKNAQNALRRRIVCEHLNKVLPDILKSLGLTSTSISSEVRLLVNTFKLKANNIMFKPIQWALIAIIVIKLLSLRDRRLEYLLEQPTAFQHLQLLLLSYKQDGGYLDRLISWLTDIDRLLDNSDTQLTVE